LALPEIFPGFRFSNHYPDPDYYVLIVTHDRYNIRGLQLLSPGIFNDGQNFFLNFPHQSPD